MIVLLLPVGWPPRVMILTVGGDAASKGAQEVMQALAIIDNKAPDWKYICKVWPQPCTKIQNPADRECVIPVIFFRNDVMLSSV